MKPYAYCPQCATPLIEAEHGGRLRRACPDTSCGFIHWDNPVPVVAAVVEHEGKIILARNVAWPASFYALITGFLEREESPEIGVQREFTRNNQLIVAYHVPATGTVKLNEELADWKHVAFEDIQYWPAGTGYAVRDWLRGKGYDPQPMAWPKR